MKRNLWIILVNIIKFFVKNLFSFNKLKYLLIFITRTFFHKKLAHSFALVTYFIRFLLNRERERERVFFWDKNRTTAESYSRSRCNPTWPMRSHVIRSPVSHISLEFVPQCQYLLWPILPCFRSMQIRNSFLVTWPTCTYGSFLKGISPTY